MDMIIFMPIKRVIAFQLEQEMKEHNLSKAALARRMKTSRAALDRLLDPENPSATLLTLENAALALNKTLAVQMV
jgi:transcriptional regulator with XRE-family HTH domain